MALLRQGQIWSHRLFHGQKWNFCIIWKLCSYTPQNCFKRSNIWTNEIKWVSKVKVIIWPWPKVTEVKIKLVFLGNCRVIWNQILYESLWMNVNENLYKWVGSHDQDGRHAHIWYKSLKSYSPEPMNRRPWNFVCSIWYQSSTNIVQMITLDWSWLFYTIVKYGKMLMHRISLKALKILT